MKVLLLLFALGLSSTMLPSSVNAKGGTEQANKSLSLRGRVESVEIEENTSHVSAFIRVKLQLEFVNTGTEPIILLRRKPWFGGTALAKEKDDFEKGEFLAADDLWPSISIDPEWAALRASLNKPSPPTDETRILMPNESWPLEVLAGVSVPIDPSKYTSSRKKESLQVIQQLSPVWLRVTCEMWPWNVEERGPEREKLKFGHELQERWKDVGLLWLEDVRSEPIMLDLKTATYKTASR